MTRRPCGASSLLVAIFSNVLTVGFAGVPVNEQASRSDAVILW
jgi:hypothetical protein